MWMGQSSLEISRDSIFIVVKDQSLPLRQLEVGQDEDLIQKYASSTYLKHI
jgi:hypothetical protein